MAWASLWLTAASILAAFEIRKAVRADGTCVEPSGAHTSFFVRYATLVASHYFQAACKTATRNRLIARLYLVRRRWGNWSWIRHSMDCRKNDTFRTSDMIKDVRFESAPRLSINTASTDSRDNKREYNYTEVVPISITTDQYYFHVWYIMWTNFV